MDTKTFGDCIKILLCVTVKTKVSIFKEGTKNRIEERNAWVCESHLKYLIPKR